MQDAPRIGADGRSQTDRRLAAVRARLSELRQRTPGPATPGEWQRRVEAAQRHAAAAQAAAIEQLTYSATAFRRAAQAHDRAAAEHECAAASGTSQPDEHKRQAAIHREAAVHDRQRAGQVQSLLSAAAGGSQPARDAAPKAGEILRAVTG
jgi:hypothetical protein